MVDNDLLFKVSMICRYTTSPTAWSPAAPTTVWPISRTPRTRTSRPPPTPPSPSISQTTTAWAWLVLNHLNQVTPTINHPHTTLIIRRMLLQETPMPDRKLLLQPATMRLLHPATTPPHPFIQAVTPLHLLLQATINRHPLLITKLQLLQATITFILVMNRRLLPLNHTTPLPLPRRPFTTPLLLLQAIILPLLSMIHQLPPQPLPADIILRQ